MKNPTKTIVVRSQAPDEQKLAWKPKAAARLLGLAEGTVYRLVAQGIIPSVTIGSRILIPADALKKWLNDGVK